MRKGVIFLVPVPIGNLKDITLRALELLAQVRLIACEDTRKTAFLLNHFEIEPPKLLSFHKFNERSREKSIFAYLEKGEDLAIVSDAGSPAISDPAQALVAEAINRDYTVQALPGATALIPALCVSGFNTQAFQFLGFLPPKRKERDFVLRQVAQYPHPSIIYESVHHLKTTLAEMLCYFPERKIAIAREISKLHEECVRGKLQEIVEEYKITEKGEFVIVVDAAPALEIEFPNAEAEKMLQTGAGKKSKVLAAELSDRFGISKNTAYKYVLEHRK